jgi:hypothetical protein
MMWEKASVLLGYDLTLYPRITQAMFDHVRYVLCNHYLISGYDNYGKWVQ